MNKEQSVLSKVTQLTSDKTIKWRARENYMFLGDMADETYSIWNIFGIDIGLAYNGIDVVVGIKHYRKLHKLYKLVKSTCTPFDSEQEKNYAIKNILGE